MCIDRFGSLNDLYNEYISNDIHDLVIIGIGKDDNKSVNEIVAGNVLPYIKENNENNIREVWEPIDRDLFFIKKNGVYDRKINLTSGFNVNQIKSIINNNLYMLSNSVSMLPEELNLSVFPNPFNPLINIVFSIPKSTFCSVIIYDIQGKIIDELENSYLFPGNYRLAWNAEKYSSGVYFLKLKTDFQIYNQKLIFTK